MKRIVSVILVAILAFTLAPTITLATEANEIATATTYPAVDTLTARISDKYDNDNSIELWWESAIGIEDGYRIYRSLARDGDYELIAELGHSAREYVDMDITPDTTYYYKISYMVSVSLAPREESELSAPVEIKTWPSSNIVTKPPKPPGTVKAVASGDYAITVKWSKVPNADGYEVYRSGTPTGGYKLIKETYSDSFSYKNTGRQAGKTYYYKVRAVRYGNNKTYKSAYSAAAKAKSAIDGFKITAKITAVNPAAGTLAINVKNNGGRYLMFHANWEYWGAYYDVNNKSNLGVFHGVSREPSYKIQPGKSSTLKYELHEPYKYWLTDGGFFEVDIMYKGKIYTVNINRNPDKTYYEKKANSGGLEIVMPPEEPWDIDGSW